MDNLFSEKLLGQVLINKTIEMTQYIDKFTNDEIMANDLEILASNCYQKFFIEPIIISEEDFGKRTINQQKINVPVDQIWTEVYGKKFANVDGYSFCFYYPYTGDRDLFYCRASTYSISGYPSISLGLKHICFQLVIA